MTTNTLFQTSNDASSSNNTLHPPPLPTMNSFLTGNDSIGDASIASTSIFSTIPAHKKDISIIPPAFFVASPENMLSLNENMETIRNQRNLSIGYGDRRLSGVLSEKPEGTISGISKKQESQDESIKKQIALDTADAQRGLFGNGDVQKKRREPSPSQDGHLSSSLKISQSHSKTIRVFGYPANLVNNVISHFNKYGKIDKYQQAPGGNWISITYEKNASALAALKSNGVIISKNHLIGVTLEEVSANAVAQNIVPLNESNDVFKKFTSNTTSINGLGKGKVGVSAVDKSNAGTESVESVIFSKLKDIIFGW